MLGEVVRGPSSLHVVTVIPSVLSSSAGRKLGLDQISLPE